MNIIYLKYAVMVADTRSISRAAENLYMGQPNLSRAIKELESSVGITIFRRTARGIDVTPEGEEFLRYAREIISRADELERRYKNKTSERLSVCFCRGADYVQTAFGEFIREYPENVPADLSAVDAESVINSVSRNSCSLGIVRYEKSSEKKFRGLFEEKKLIFETIAEFPRIILASKNSPFCAGERLEKLTEIFLCNEKCSGNGIKLENVSPYPILGSAPNTFTRCALPPTEMLEKYSLTAFPDEGRYKDVLIYREDYRLADADKFFITKLCEVRRRFA